jgi:hypothetical protein
MSHAAATKSPVGGRYVYRAAIACPLACTRPIAGTSIPRYQNNPSPP